MRHGEIAESGGNDPQALSSSLCLANKTSTLTSSDSILLRGERGSRTLDVFYAL